MSTAAEILDERLVNGLDPAQAAAVTLDAFPLAIIAAAGSGKTSVLTRRIAHRIRAGTAEEQHTVALTFSRQAAFELGLRLARLDVRGVTTGTFHAVAYAVLRQRWADLGRPAPGLMVHRNHLLTDAIGPHTSGRRRLEPHELGSELDWARAQRIGDAQYPEAAKVAGRRTAATAGAIAEAMVRFAELKRHRRVIDFDDLLELALVEQLRDPGFAAQIHWRFRHFFVDEFQDVNPLQHALLEAWRGGRPDLCVVGDPRQAIYGWNGADPKLLDRVEATYPGVQVVRLRANYRCSPAIVSAAAAVLTVGTQGPDDSIARRAEPGSITLVGAASPEAEAAAVADRLRLLHLPGTRWSSMAVLARTNHQLEPVQAAFARAGIPAQVSSRATPTADDPARRTLLADARRCTSAVALAAWGRDLDDGIDEIASSAMHRKMAGAVRAFLGTAPHGTGAAFAEWFELTGGDDEYAERRDAVALLTFHAAKGREWRSVAVVGAEVGLVPHSGSSSPEAAAEEVRLLYVALTRASEHLVISWADERGGRPTGRSPLLAAVEATTGGTSTPVPEALRRALVEPTVDPILDALEQWRHRAAVAAALPPIAVCDDTVLQAVARRRPTTIDELAAVPGFGPLAATRLGPRLLAVLAEATLGL